jgi:hypothetical protein
MSLVSLMVKPLSAGALARHHAVAVDESGIGVGHEPVSFEAPIERAVPRVEGVTAASTRWVA